MSKLKKEGINGKCTEPNLIYDDTMIVILVVELSYSTLTLIFTNNKRNENARNIALLHIWFCSFVVWGSHMSTCAVPRMRACYQQNRDNSPPPAPCLQLTARARIYDKIFQNITKLIRCRNEKNIWWWRGVGSEPVVWVSLRRSCSENSEFVVFLSLDDAVS